MSRGPRLLLAALILCTLAALVAIGLAVLSNWFFHGEASLSSDALFRLVLLSLLIGAMPVGLMWARSRKGKE